MIDGVFCQDCVQWNSIRDVSQPTNAGSSEVIERILSGSAIAGAKSSPSLLTRTCCDPAHFTNTDNEVLLRIAAIVDSWKENIMQLQYSMRVCGTP